MLSESSILCLSQLSRKPPLESRATGSNPREQRRRMSKRLQVAQSGGGRCRSGLDAVRDSQAPVAIAGQEQPRMMGEPGGNLFQAAQMAYSILRHALFPAVNSAEGRLRTRAHDLAQFPERDLDNAAVLFREDRGIARSSEEAPQ